MVDNLGVEGSLRHYSLELLVEPCIECKERFDVGFVGEEDKLAGFSFLWQLRYLLGRDDGAIFECDRLPSREWLKVVSWLAAKLRCDLWQELSSRLCRDAEVGENDFVRVAARFRSNWIHRHVHVSEGNSLSLIDELKL